MSGFGPRGWLRCCFQRCVVSVCVGSTVVLNVVVSSDKGLQTVNIERCCPWIEKWLYEF
jgi:hypothetical protein